MSSGHRIAVFTLLCLLMATAQAAPAPRVVVSIKPMHSLAAGIMQGIAEPLLLLDDPQPPWRQALDAGQHAALANADLIIWSGAELEPALGAALHGAAPHARVFEALSSDELKILPARGQTTTRDGFFWLDSRNMLILLDDLTRMLMQMDPQNAFRYERNRARMLPAIAEIDRQMEYGYRDVSGIPVFFYHDTHQ
jgi:ABC-type Zn2+ transport system substrate-binding protein/surface adhesin